MKVTRNFEGKGFRHETRPAGRLVVRYWPMRRLACRLSAFLLRKQWRRQSCLRVGNKISAKWRRRQLSGPCSKAQARRCRLPSARSLSCLGRSELQMITNEGNRPTGGQIN